MTKHLAFSEILDMLENRLNGPAKKSAQDHLKTDCKECKAQYDWAARSLPLLKANNSLFDAPEFLVQKAVALFPKKKASFKDWIVAKLEFDSWTAPQMAGVRSADRGLRQQTFSSESYKILVMGGDGNLVGQLMANKPGADFGGCLVEAIHSKKVLASTTTSSSGEFVLHMPPRKRVQIKIHGDQESILISYPS
jgi:hypothetical protein